GFLLTGEPQYLEPMEAGLGDARTRLDELVAIYRQLDPGELPALQSAQQDLADKTQEMLQSVALHRAGQSRQALELVKSDLGLRKMEALANTLGGLRARERERVSTGLAEWDAAMRLNTIIGLSSMLFTIVVLIALGLLVTRDIRRRDGFAT